jgi:rhodanese-related sulfurtransferase
LFRTFPSFVDLADHFQKPPKACGQHHVSFFIENWALIALALTSGGMLFWHSMQKSSGVGPAEAVRLINREKAVLIDVSEPAEFAASHPTGARNIPFGSLQGSKELPGNKTLPLVLVCPSGTRAGRAVGLLKKAGHDRVVAVSGGLAAWKEAGLPVGKKAA